MSSPPRIVLPTFAVGPLRSVLYRVGIAFLLLLAVVVIVYLDRGGYKDSADGSVTLLDALYYATVTISTTGYGDITPVSQSARLVNVIAITPLRVLFLIILVGTTLEVLAERSRDEWRRNRWRSRVRDHIVVVGYGTKGRSAVVSLLAAGVSPDGIVVVDPSPGAVAEANGEGLVGIVGDATRTAVLREAGVPTARQIIIAAQRDDTAVLITLTARDLNPTAGIQASVREAENVPLLRQSGADHVVTSSEAAGRLLGVAAHRPNVSEVVEDLLIQGSRLDLEERSVHAHEVGKNIRETDEPALALVRGGALLPYSSPDIGPLRKGDRLVVVACADEEE